MVWILRTLPSGSSPPFGLSQVDAWVYMTCILMPQKLEIERRDPLFTAANSIRASKSDP